MLRVPSRSLAQRQARAFCRSLEDAEPRGYSDIARAFQRGYDFFQTYVIERRARVRIAAGDDGRVRVRVRVRPSKVFVPGVILLLEVLLERCALSRKIREIGGERFGVLAVRGALIYFIGTIANDLLGQEGCSEWHSEEEKRSLLRKSVVEMRTLEASALHADPAREDFAFAFTLCTVYLAFVFRAGHACPRTETTKVLERQCAGALVRIDLARDVLEAIKPRRTAHRRLRRALASFSED